MKKLTLKNLLKQKNSEVMLVDKSLANTIKNISNTLNTSTTDTLCAAMKLLELSINNDIVLKEDDGRERVIKALSKDIKK